MKKKLVKRIAIGTGSLLGLLLVVLCVHIYIVTRPRPVDPRAIVMARIDMHQDIGQQDADRITRWLDTQPGVSHTLVNPQTEIVVFTFFPARASANEIVKNFKADLHYENAVRFMPTAAQLSGGCPAGYGRASHSLLSMVTHLFQ